MFSQTFLNDQDRKEERKYWKKQLLKNRRMGVTKAVKGVINRKGVFEELSNIIAPTLILIGDEDVATPSKYSNRIHSAIPNSKLVTVPRAGHSSTIEEPDVINNEIKSFLQELK
ncbi:MAG: putative non-heme bromoperoxidase BpoC [Candidatus Heimdallarchaeota archaeon LC_3]|nr:MAG: putative non-heme bromoperoxidase BpoC [Candidatus Heimdallarchaeota archaeon LC_3]